MLPMFLRVAKKSMQIYSDPSMKQTCTDIDINLVPSVTLPTLCHEICDAISIHARKNGLGLHTTTVRGYQAVEGYEQQFHAQTQHCPSYVISRERPVPLRCRRSMATFDLVSDKPAEY